MKNCRLHSSGYNDTRGVIALPPNNKSWHDIWKENVLAGTADKRTCLPYGNSMSRWHEWRKSSFSHVASSLVWLLHCTLKDLIILHLVTGSIWSKMLTGCSRYVKSASRGVTSGNTTSTGALKNFFSCDMWKILWTLANDGRNSNLYATFPHFLSMAKDPM
jgi:hypothetical protein